MHDHIFCSLTRMKHNFQQAAITPPPSKKPESSAPASAPPVFTKSQPNPDSNVPKPLPMVKDDVPAPTTILTRTQSA